jgi:hypothetical protein
MLALTVKVITLSHMPRQPIWTRLGFRESQAQSAPFPPEQARLVDRFIAETQVRLFYTELPYTVTKHGEVDLGGYRFLSGLVRERFGAAEAVLVMGSSALAGDVARLGSLQARGEMQSAVVLDAVLSEKTDFGLDFIEQEIAPVLRRGGRAAGRRLSCGYGDFSLENQKFFYNTLDFGKYGIGINDRFILSPEKTVTALLPIYTGKAPSR